jgi:hypothetical protein
MTDGRTINTVPSPDPSGPRFFFLGKKMIKSKEIFMRIYDTNINKTTTYILYCTYMYVHIIYVYIQICVFIHKCRQIYTHMYIKFKKSKILGNTDCN